MPISPTWEHEEAYWKEGIKAIAGVDEAGMGCLAGPVVAGAVIFKMTNYQLPITNLKLPIRDSKTLSLKQRLEAEEWIKENALSWAIGEANVEEIDKINIRQASHLAARRAVDGLDIKAELILIDGNPAQIHSEIPTVNIIDGDALSFSIASASILAKTHRDRIMQRLHEEFPMYNWEGNKGYGAKVHMEALREHGATPYHRRSYKPVAEVC